MSVTFTLSNAFQPNATSRTVDAFIETHSFDPKFWLAATEADLARIREWLESNHAFRTFHRNLTALILAIVVAMFVGALLYDATAMLLAFTAGFFVAGPVYFDGPGPVIGRILGFGRAQYIAQGLDKESPRRVAEFKACLVDHPEAVAFLEEVGKRRAVVWADYRCAKRMAGLNH